MIFLIWLLFSLLVVCVSMCLSVCFTSVTVVIVRRRCRRLYRVVHAFIYLLIRPCVIYQMLRMLKRKP